MQHPRAIFVVSLLFSLFATSVSAKEVVGWVENVRLYPGDILVRAKLDSGAKTSSLHCDCITPIMVDGKQWVSFSVEGNSGKIHSIKKPIKRIAKIKRHFGEVQIRYVIEMGVCLGNVFSQEEITLVDRSGFNYPMLIGRSFLKKRFLLDPGKTYTTKPDCSDVKTDEK